MLLKTLNLCSIGKKTLWVKEKILVTSIFSFSHNVYQRCFPEGHEMSSLSGKGLNKDFFGHLFGRVDCQVLIILISVRFVFQKLIDYSYRGVRKAVLIVFYMLNLSCFSELFPITYLHKICSKSLLN